MCIRDRLAYSHVAVPIADLAPYYVHPETGATLAEIAAKLPAAGVHLRQDVDLALRSTPYPRE